MFYKIAGLFIVFMVLAGGFLFHSGCRPLPVIEPEKKDGKTYGEISGSAFPYKWYDYYEGALSFAEGGYWKQAETYLKEAIRQRGEDQWNARTYGRHFIDYFPNREMGIVYYSWAENDNSLNEKDKIKKMLMARMQLHRSVSQTPSAKAIFYLNELYQNYLFAELEKNKSLFEDVYKELLAENKDLLEEDIRVVKSTPVITLEEPKASSNGIRRTGDYPVTFSGYVEDDNYITSIMIEGNPVFLLNSSEDRDLYKFETSSNGKKRFPFKKQISLSHGNQLITIEAKNIMGELNLKDEGKFDIMVDWMGPIAEITTYPYKEQIVINGSLHDQDEISQAFINEKEISIQKGIKFSLNQIITANCDNPIRLLAYDSLGNETSTQIKDSLSSYERDSILYACANPKENTFIAQDDRFRCPEAERIQEESENPTIVIKAKFLENNQITEKKLEDITAINPVTAFLERMPINVEIIEGNHPIEEIVVDGITEFKDKTTQNYLHRRFCFGYAIDLREYPNGYRSTTIKVISRDKRTFMQEITPCNSTTIKIDGNREINFDRINNNDDVISQERLRVIIQPFSFYKNHVRLSNRNDCRRTNLSDILPEDCLMSLRFRDELNESILSTWDLVTHKRRFSTEELSSIIIDENSKIVYLDTERNKDRNEKRECPPSVYKRIAIIGKIAEGDFPERGGVGFEIKAELFDLECNSNIRISNNELYQIDAFIKEDRIKAKNRDEYIDNAFKQLSQYLANKLSLEFPSLIGKVRDNPTANNAINTDVIDRKLKINSRLIPYNLNENIRPLIVDKTTDMSLAELFPTPETNRFRQGDDLITE